MCRVNTIILELFFSLSSCSAEHGTERGAERRAGHGAERGVEDTDEDDSDEGQNVNVKKVKTTIKNKEKWD